MAPVTGLPFALIDGIEAGVIAFILSGMWWKGLDRIHGVKPSVLVLGTIATTAVIGAGLLYLDLRSTGRPRQPG